MVTKNKEETKKVSKVVKNKTWSGKVTVTKKNTSKKTNSKSQIKPNNTTITLPKKMSKESVIKAKSLHKELDEYIKYSIFKVAYVSAFCFIAVGAVLSLFSLREGSFFVSKYQTAQLVSIDGTTIETLDVSTDRTAIVDTSFNITDLVSQNEPEFYFLTDIPDELTSDYVVSFQVLNASVSAVILVAIDYREKIILEPTVKDNIYSVLISSDITPGYYELRVVIVPDDGSDIQTHSSNIFYVGTRETDLFLSRENITPESLLDDETAYTTIVNNVGDDIEITRVVETEIAIEEDEDGNEDVYTYTREISTEEENEVVAEETVLDNVSIPALIENSDVDLIGDINLEEEGLNTTDLYFVLSIREGSVLSETSEIYATISEEVRFVELYLRPLNSLTGNFVTLGIKNSTGWRFVFDTKNFRNGDYVIYVKTVLNNRELKSEPKVITINNNFVVPVVLETDLSDVDILENEEITREFVEVEEEIVLNDTEQLFPKVQEEAERLFKENSIEIEELFKTYAVSLQSEDSILSELVKQQISELQKSISIESLSDDETRYYSDDIDELLKNKFVDLKNKIEIFEELRRDRSSGNTSKDSDSDGVSDFDEINLYKTDPKIPDTDNDGVSDGVEIISGYNPLNSEVEAVVSFESPKNTIGLERSDFLTVEEVVPIINIYNEDSGEETVRTSIRGKALQNSYITLYIFSSPTVVTVKTDADGSFEYTFDKELEDGQHDIYVAVTDNAGSIVAQSSPFSFVKQAQAFTPVDVVDSEIVTQNTIIETSKNSYATVLGIAVLSLGIILLMLGVGLRPKNADDIVVAEMDASRQKVAL